MLPILLPIGLALSLLTTAPPADPALQESVEPTPASETAAPEESDGGWSFFVRPYLWAASLSGSVGVQGLGSVDVDRDFGEIVEDLDFAWMVQLEARAPDERLGLLLDTFYIDLDGQDGPADWDLEQTLLELDATWALADGLDVLVGARYVDIDASASAPELMLGFDRNESWVDPVVGLRGRYQLGERWSLRGRGDIGGFGVGSDFSWQLAAYLAYSVSPRLDLGLGYRHLDIRRDEDGLDLDFALSGPVLGIGFQF